MVSTQNTFFSTPGFPTILGTTALSKGGCAQRVITNSAVTTTPPAFDTEKIANVIDQVNSDSEAVLSGVSYNGKQPKSVADLLAMGAKRNDTAQTENGIDETAAFHNDVTYFKALLEAREKHRAAMQAKLHALRVLRTKQRKMYRKRKPSQRTAAILAAALVRAGSNPNNGVDKQMPREDNWQGPPPEPICASPFSTDVESEASSDLGDVDSYEKPVMFRA